MQQQLSNGADEKEKHIRIQDIDVYFNNVEKHLKRAQVISESPLLLQPYVSKCLENAKPLFWNVKRTADQAIVYFDYFKAAAECEQKNFFSTFSSSPANLFIIVEVFCFEGNYAYFVKEDQTALPKTVAIALAAMGGFLMGFRKGTETESSISVFEIIVILVVQGDKLSMASYSLLATSLAAVFCYPQPTVKLIQQGAEKLLQYRWNHHSSAYIHPLPILPSASPQSRSSSSLSSATTTSTASDSRDSDMYTTRSDRIA
ncbi:hypothetical protein D917_07183 [Trichinella nativa]|uniref:MICOS complex subunit n=1 Tax=Trichinella nativa TaxID=6335 RepID=A0A1Y3EPL0_9BILA|nr:hypothetical protein D917_07183 [Trichinella nativa]